MAIRAPDGANNDNYYYNDNHLEWVLQKKKSTESQIVAKTAVVEELAQEKPSGVDEVDFDAVV